MRDYYDILQVSPNAEPEVIGAAYRRLARKYHPDVYAELDATERMRELNEAYEVLSNPARRAEYDRSRRYERQEARRDEREAPPRPPREERTEPAKAAETPPREPARRLTIPIVSGLLGLIVVGSLTAGAVLIAVRQADEGDDTSSRAATEGVSGSPSSATSGLDRATRTPTPSRAATPTQSAAWCWHRKAQLDLNQIGIDHWKSYGFDYRESEERRIVGQREFETYCGGDSLVPTRSGALDESCDYARDTEYEWRQGGEASYWTSKLEYWQEVYCQ